MHVAADGRPTPQRVDRADADGSRPADGPRRPPAGGRGGARPAGPLGPHLRAARPDAVAVGRRAAADHRDAARHRRAPARVHHAAGRPSAGGAGLRHRLRARAACPRRWSRRAAEREFPVFEVPYEVPFIAITEAAFTQLVNEQYAVLRRALAAQERLERIVLSERGLDALAGDAGDADRRRRARVRRPRRAARPARLPAAGGAARRWPRCRPSCASARAGARPAAFMPARRGRQAGRWRCRSPPTARPVRAPPGRRAYPEAWLVAIKDTGPLSDFDRLTLHQAVTIVALELLRARVAGDTERRLAGDVLAAVVRGELAGAGAGPPAGAVRARRTGWRRSWCQRPDDGRGSPGPGRGRRCQRRCATTPRRAGGLDRAR